MSTLAIVLFIAGALLLAAILIVSSVRAGRDDERELEAARARATAARQEADVARDARRRLVDPAEQLAAARDDPRGLGDGIGGPASGRFRRPAEAPAPSPRAGRPART